MKKSKPLNPPVIWVWTFVIVLLSLALAFGPANKRLNLHEVRFKTTSSSILYFKNIRSFYYQIIEKRKPLTLYRNKDYQENDSSSELPFTIITNPLADEAYIYVETERFKQLAPLSVFIIGHDSDTLSYKDIGGFNNEGHFKLAVAVYEGLSNQSQILLSTKGNTAKVILNTDEDRKTAITVLEDYFKLVNKL